MSEELKPITAADLGFDADEPNARGVLVFLIAMVLFFIAVVVGVSYYYNYVHGQEEYSKLMAPTSQELGALHAREDWELRHYSYLDKAKGQVRIPIDRAMELLASEAAAGRLRYPQSDQAPKKPEPVQATAAPAPMGASK